MISWNDFVPALEELYVLKGKKERLDDDLTYLEKVFAYTEALWHKNFEQMSDIRFVLLGEAPVLDNYIYDDTTSLTAFFHHRVDPCVESVSLSDKARLLPMLRKSGFLVVDIFPFAFGKQTAVQYPGRTNAAFEMMFESLLERYLLPKLDLIKVKAIPSIQFAWRYRKQKALTELLAARLEEIELLSPRDQIGCVGSSNMSIDTYALECLFARARTSATA